MVRWHVHKVTSFIEGLTLSFIISTPRLETLLTDQHVDFILRFVFGYAHLVKAFSYSTYGKICGPRDMQNEPAEPTAARLVD